MATVELTFEQVLDAAQQLPDEERVALVCQLFERPAAGQSRQDLEDLRLQFEMPLTQQQRMSALAAKSRARTMTPPEREELDGLANDFRDRALAMARAASDGRGANGEKRNGR